MIAAHVTWLLSTRGGGIPPVVFAIANSQRGSGHDVRVLGVRDRAGEAIGNAVTVPAVGPISIGWAPRLRRELSTAAADVLHLHGLFTWPSHAARMWGRRTGRPVVISPHGMLEPWALANSAWKKRAFRWAVEDDNLHRAACLHALCTPEASNMRKIGLRNPIAVVPNGVELPVDGRGRVEAFESRFPACNGRRRMLFLGRIHPKKGLLHLVEAWAAARHDASRDLAEWVLVIAGPDQLGHARDVARLVHERGLDRDILFTGPLHGEEKEQALASASAFVLPSFSEGFSVAVLEAMARRLPVLVTHQCNLDVEAFGGGILAEPNAESIKRQLLRLFEMSPAERGSMGGRGRREVEARYTWPHVARDLLNVYGWILGQDARPACVETV
jgi:glycosyltransferase involved in cell wall biosynthesis